MIYKIGDRVRVRQYEDIPEEARNRGLGKQAGKEGIISDILQSSIKNCVVYRITFDGCNMPSRTDFVEGTFDLVSKLDKPAYDFEFEYLENLVVARLYEYKDNHKKLVARGHGHIFHDGVLGIAQAASYALKKLYKFLEEGHD